jgi:GNAT superfamily N-acetyltransferase
MDWTNQPIRVLGAQDLPDCLALAVNRGWPPEKHKWGLLLAAGRGYGVDDEENGGLAGVVVCTRYGNTLGAIGMMLVAGRHERRGLGSRLMRHVMADAGVATMWLTATEFGRPLYEKLGFRAIDECTQYVGLFAGNGVPPRSRPATESDLSAIVALDADVFGADRSAVLLRLPAFGEALRVVDSSDGRLAGYGGAWRNADNTVIGPVVADDQDTARALLTDLAAAQHGPIRLGLVHSRPEQIEWALAHGLRPGPGTTVMVSGADLPGDRKRLFNPLMVAMG